MKTMFYYWRDENNRPLVTTCRIEQNGESAQGWAICSAKDNPCKKTGRKIAQERARWALEHKMDNCYTERPEVFRILLQAGLTGAYFDFAKSRYNPTMNAIERQIVGIAA